MVLNSDSRIFEDLLTYKPETPNLQVIKGQMRLNVSFTHQACQLHKYFFQHTETRFHFLKIHQRHGNTKTICQIQMAGTALLY